MLAPLQAEGHAAAIRQGLCEVVGVAGERPPQELCQDGGPSRPCMLILFQHQRACRTHTADITLAGFQDKTKHRGQRSHSLAPAKGTGACMLRLVRRRLCRLFVSCEQAQLPDVPEKSMHVHSSIIDVCDQETYGAVFKAMRASLILAPAACLRV